MDNKTSGRRPTFVEAIIPVILVATFILYGTVVLKVSPHIPMFLALIVCILFAFYLKYPWSEIEKAINQGIFIGLLPMLIMILIGMVIGSWIACGTVPYIIHLGLQIISPKWFLFTSLITCSVMSFFIGSSWTTAGTVGVALMGIGYGLGIPPAMTAGAVISGAMFGDKQSPLSETTNFAPAVAETTLFEHIHSMLYSTAPAYIITAIIFIILGFNFGGETLDNGKIELIANTLQNSFYFSPILLIPPVILIIIVVKKVPAILGMGIAVLLGFIFSIIFQGIGLIDIFNYMHYGYIGQTGVEVVDALITKGGLNSMMWTISLMFLSLPMGGLLEKTGTLEAILNKLSNMVKSTLGLVTTTLISVLVLNFVTADSYLPMLLAGRTFKPAFDKLKIHHKVLSRSLEDTGTLGSAMVPWAMNGVFMASTLGVSTFSYLPYYFLGILTPFVSVILAATGIGIWYIDEKGNIVEKSKKISKMPAQ